MAGELVKWIGGKLVKPSSALERCREAREAAELALNAHESVTPLPMDRRMKEAMKVREPKRNFDIGIPPIPEIYDLPRICTVRKLPYVSRYVLREGRYEYAQEIRHKQGMNAVEYEAGYAVTFPLAEEVCAWCRAWGYAAIFCPKCKAWFCYGNVTGKVARCACGQEGRIGAGETEAIGLAPRR